MVTILLRAQEPTHTPYNEQLFLPTLLYQTYLQFPIAEDVAALQTKVPAFAYEAYADIVCENIQLTEHPRTKCRH